VTNVEVIPTRGKRLCQRGEEEGSARGRGFIAERGFSQQGSLKTGFSFQLSNLRRSAICQKNPIQITEYDQGNNRIKTNYSTCEIARIGQGPIIKVWFVNPKCGSCHS